MIRMLAMEINQDRLVNPTNTKRFDELELLCARECECDVYEYQLLKKLYTRFIYPLVLHRASWYV